MLAVSTGMIVVPLIYPFRTPDRQTRILGPTATTVLFIVGGLVLLAMTLNKVRLARALAAHGCKITVDGDRVTYPRVQQRNGQRSDVRRFCRRIAARTTIEGGGRTAHHPRRRNAHRPGFGILRLDGAIRRLLRPAEKVGAAVGARRNAASAAAAVKGRSG